MSHLRLFFLRLYNLFRPRQAERHLAREITSHLALLEADFRRGGT